MMKVISLFKKCLPVTWVNGLKSVLFKCAIWRLKWSLGRHFSWMRKRAEIIRKKGKISVLFEVFNTAMWKSDSVYQLMKKSGRFDPVICVIPPQNDVSEQEKINTVLQTENDFRNKGYQVIAAPSLASAIKNIRPDITFVCQPYEFSTIKVLIHRMRETLYCYVPYGFRNTESLNSYNNLLQNKYWYNFVENSYIEHFSSKVMYNHGANVCNVGYPPFDDAFACPDKCSAWRNAAPSQKRVIWAPHWSVNVDKSYGFVVSCFLSLAHTMLELAREYSDSVYFAFKPHPFLHAALCLHPDWGKERTDAYYKLWEELPNAQIELGGYSDLFAQSDALIHDCGSFIVEYLVCDKPCLYLCREKGDHAKFNKINLEALNCHYKGQTIDDVRSFIDSVLLGGEDSKKSVRAEFKREYIVSPHGKTAAQNIVDAILGGGASFFL